MQISQHKVSEKFPTQGWPYHKELKPLICAANFSAVKHRKNYLFNASSGVPYINHVICEYFFIIQMFKLKIKSMIIVNL